MATGFGCTVEMQKMSVTIFLGGFEPLGPQVPSWSGYSEWVAPDATAGRHVLETCWHKSDGGEYIIHSVKVANWTDHPNLPVVRALGLPDALWAASGQASLEASTNLDWFMQQMEAIDRALQSLGRKAAFALLLDAPS